jgi:hypothetical protein
LAHVLMIVMLLLLPETRGRAIASLEPEAPDGAAYPPGQPSGAVEASRARLIRLAVHTTRARP